jgi:hypothetical protein
VVLELTMMDTNLETIRKLKILASDARRKSQLDLDPENIGMKMQIVL